MNLVSPLVQRWVLDAREDPEAFWGRAAEELPWFRKWDRVFEWTPPTFRWFIGGQTNVAYNALDYHVKRGWGGHTALVYITERGERQAFTYAQMLHEVKRLAAALHGMGIQKGDCVTIYMPTCPEAIMLMLATARIGAIHIVVFAGFGAQALGDRVQASGSRLIFATDITYRKGKDVQLKGIVDASLERGNGSVERVVILNRAGESTFHDRVCCHGLRACCPCPRHWPCECPGHGGVL
jgi:acetyl-CoA synthetase